MFHFTKFVINHVLIEMRPEMDGKCGSQGKPMNCDFPGIVTEGFTIPKTVFSKYIFVKICVWLSDLN